MLKLVSILLLFPGMIIGGYLLIFTTSEEVSETLGAESHFSSPADYLLTGLFVLAPFGVSVAQALALSMKDKPANLKRNFFFGNIILYGALLSVGIIQRDETSIGFILTLFLLAFLSIKIGIPLAHVNDDETPS